MQLYIESFEHDEPVDEKIKEPIVRRPTSAAKNKAGRSKGDLIEDLGVEREDSEDGILDEFSLRQALSDHDEKTWKRFRPIFISLMNRFLEYNGISMNCICAQD